jgi:hypothetical protein
MKVLLIDADSTIPNIALMKLSNWYKNKGATVTLHKCYLPYFPNKKKTVYYAPYNFNKIYCSVIFEGNKNFIQGENIIFGGTGFDLATKLPEEIENYEPDYTLYPENNTSYGFITRGCIRNCDFCKVFKKEGYIHKVSNIDNIVKHKKVKFLDNNILAYPKHKEILQELIDKKIKCQFNQGLDIRLIDKDNSKLLSKLNYLNEYTFSFDHWELKETIETKLNILQWIKPWKARFFIYVNPSMPLNETVKRVLFLKNKKCLPYIMRDIQCWYSKYKDFYTDICAYTNQVNIFKKMDFASFLSKRHTVKNYKNRIKESLKLWKINR